MQLKEAHYKTPSFGNQFGRDEVENEGLRSQIQTDRWKRAKNQKLFLCDLREEFY